MVRDAGSEKQIKRSRMAVGRSGALTPALFRRERGNTNCTRRPGKRSATGRKESTMSALPSPEYSRNMRLIGHSDSNNADV
ncbi:hypothetical protein FHB93_21820, partial [Klebsiella quasipneumoniae]